MDITSNISISTLLSALGCLIVIFLTSLLWKLRRGIHLSKDQCIDAVVSGCAMSYESNVQEWSSPTMDGDVASDAICGSGLYYWRVPTSIFFGLNPTTMGNAKIHNQEKDRDEIKIEVYNPAEERKQTETLKQTSYTGIILRGGRLHGWTSQNVDMRNFPQSLFYWASSPVPALALEMNSILSDAARSLEQLGCTARGASFNAKHWRQLRDIAAGGGESTVEVALKGILSYDETSK